MMLSFLAAWALLLCSCDKPGNDNNGNPVGNVTADREAITVSSSATVETLTVTSDCDWGISSNDTGWLTVSPSGGISGTTSVRVTIAENGTGDVRESALVIRYGTRNLTIPVRQNYLVSAVEISDPAFKAYLLSEFDVDNDGVLSTKEAEAITRINASGKGIKAMPEIGSAFPNLVSLDCSGNELSELDIRNLYRLEYFNATGNPSLTAIYVWSGFEAGSNFLKDETAKWVEPEIDTPLGYTLVWQEEFNTPGESLPSTADWWYETAEPGWVNNELQTYIAGQKGDIITALVSDGTLKIMAIKDGDRVYSARLNTTGGWTYGYFEARLKLPKGLGTWPAFWMMQKNYTEWPGGGELDIMEHVGADLNEVSSSVHCQSYYHVTGNQPTAARHLAGATDDFHVYALEWTEEYIKTYVDGEQLLYYNPEEFGRKVRDHDSWPFTEPFGLKLNLAFGGDWGGYKGVDYDSLPQTFEVDYVRVFQKTE